MAEKTTTKKTTTKAAAEKPAAKTTAAKVSTATKVAEKKPATRRAPAKVAAAKEGTTPRAATTAATTAGKAVTVRKRTAATVAKARTAQTDGATGWRRFRRKTKVGVVVSAKMAKTVIVTVGRQREHPLYKKVIRLRKGFAAHDEAGDVREGDLVRIQESRPYSATKRWKVVEVLSRAGEAGAAAPKIADIERQLAEAEGTAELLTRPDREDEADENEEEEAK